MEKRMYGVRGEFSCEGTMKLGKASFQQHVKKE